VGNRRAAINFYNTAFEATRNKSFDQWPTHAFGLLQSACLTDPTFGQAWADNGHSIGALNRLHSAIACYRRALQADLGTDEKSKVLSNLSWRCHQVGELEDAAKYAQEAIDLDPTKPYPWVNLSNAHGAFGERKAAVATARKAYELDQKDTAVQFNLAFALLFDEQYAEGFKWFESRFAERLQNYLTYPYPRWLGEPDKTVFLVADQGLGDTLSFSRFLPQASAKAKFIHAMVQPALLKAFQEAFCHLSNVNFTPISTSYPSADVWTTFVSLPFALQLTDDQIKAAPHPNLPVYGMRHLDWKVPDAKLHIGIAWAGSQKNDIDRWRSLPLTTFLDLYKVPGIQLYSFQVDERRQELVQQSSEALIRDMSPWISDVTDTVSILQHLDLVVTCESALAHIAGCCGKEVWIPYSFHAHDYRYGHDGQSMLWYGKTHRLFKQGRDFRWQPMFDSIVEALREKVDAVNRETGKVGERTRPRALAGR
jgi:tetratricopeptide (TPR) repeat protein